MIRIEHIQYGLNNIQKVLLAAKLVFLWPYVIGRWQVSMYRSFTERRLVISSCIKHSKVSVERQTSNSEGKLVNCHFSWHSRS